MLSAKQKTCIDLIAKNMPEPIANTPIIMDVINDSMSHIMGGDPLESLRIKCIRQLLTNVAVKKEEKWINYLKTKNLGNFSNCFLNSSPELMMSILEHCPSPQIHTQSAKIVVNSNQILVSIENITIIKIHMESANTVVPEWMPYLIRLFCLHGLHIIRMHLDIALNGSMDIQLYEKELFAYFEKMGNVNEKTKMVNWGYYMTRGVAIFSAHANRKAGSTVFLTFDQRCSSERDIDDLMRTDFHLKLL